jgi:hypothetical protein
MLTRIFITLISLFLTSAIVSATPNADINVRDANISDTGNSNMLLESFSAPFRSFFFSP